VSATHPHTAISATKLSLALILHHPPGPSCDLVSQDTKLLEASPAQAPAKLVPSGESRRRKELHVALKRLLPRRLTNIEKLALSRAVTLTVRAEAAALDPDCNPNDVVRLDGVAARARRAWQQIAAADGARRSAVPSLSEYLARAQERASP
jgi:hypothetical protein